jgi:hypothetical protein
VITSFVADQRILRATPANLVVTILDSEGAADTTVSAVTVTVTRADGTVLATNATATNATGGSWTYAVTAAQTVDLDVFTAVWKVSGVVRATTQHEIVGGYFFTLPEARAAEPSLAGTNAPSDLQLVQFRREVEDEFERICHVAFVPRYRRVSLDGTGTTLLFLTDTYIRTVVAVTVGGATVDPANITIHSYGALELNGYWTYGIRNVVVEYEHGYDRPPSEVRRAAISRLRQRVNMARTGIPDRATSFSMGEGGTYRLDTAGPTKVGTPDIDAVLARYTVEVRIA